MIKAKCHDFKGLNFQTIILKAPKIVQCCQPRTLTKASKAYFKQPYCLCMLHRLEIDTNAQLLKGGNVKIFKTWTNLPLDLP